MLHGIAVVWDGVYATWDSCNGMEFTLHRTVVVWGGVYFTWDSCSMGRGLRYMGQL